MQATATTTPSSQPSRKWEIEGVPKENLHYVWEQAWPLVKRAIDRFPSVAKLYSHDDVATALLRGHMQLWIAWENETSSVKGAVVTEILDDPRGLAMSIPFVGGDKLAEWGDDLWLLLKRWARAHGCKAAIGYGRRGWCRLYGFVRLGASEPPVYIRHL